MSIRDPNLIRERLRCSQVPYSSLTTGLTLKTPSVRTLSALISQSPQLPSKETTMDLLGPTFLSWLMSRSVELPNKHSKPSSNKHSKMHRCPRPNLPKCPKSTFNKRTSKLWPHLNSNSCKSTGCQSTWTRKASILLSSILKCYRVYSRCYNLSMCPILSILNGKSLSIQKSMRPRQISSIDFALRISSKTWLLSSHHKTWSTRSNWNVTTLERTTLSKIWKPSKSSWSLKLRSKERQRLQMVQHQSQRKVKRDLIRRKSILLGSSITSWRSASQDRIKLSTTFTLSLYATSDTLRQSHWLSRSHARFSRDVCWLMRSSSIKLLTKLEAPLVLSARLSNIWRLLVNSWDSSLWPEIDQLKIMSWISSRC